VARLPENLTRVFYSDRGFSAVAATLKMVDRYWANKSAPRQRFIAVEGAHHGDIFRTMAVGARSLFSEVFQDLLFEMDFCPDPATRDEAKNAIDKKANYLEIISQNLTSHPNCYVDIPN